MQIKKLAFLTLFLVIALSLAAMQKQNDNDLTEVIIKNRNKRLEDQKLENDKLHKELTDLLIRKNNGQLSSDELKSINLRIECKELLLRYSQEAAEINELTSNMDSGLNAVMENLKEMRENGQIAYERARKHNINNQALKFFACLGGTYLFSLLGLYSYKRLSPDSWYRPLLLGVGTIGTSVCSLLSVEIFFYEKNLGGPIARILKKLSAIKKDSFL